MQGDDRAKFGRIFNHKIEEIVLTNKTISSIIYLVDDERHKLLNNMHEWLSGGVSPCQGEGRGFESRLVLHKLEEKT